MSQTILYTRVSTAEQTIAHQRKQAEAAGFAIDTVVTDEGVSGVSTRLADRSEGRRLFDLLRRGPAAISKATGISRQPVFGIEAATQGGEPCWRCSSGNLPNLAMRELARARELS